MPDVVDALAWPVRGELGQGMGHSLVGVVIACLPLGLVLEQLVRRFVPRRFLARLDGETRPKLGLACSSIAVGALSHDLFDLVTHANFPLLWPWGKGLDPFPSWWSRPWARIPLFVYREPYPLAPHTIVWAILSVLGVVLFVRALKKKP